MQDAPSLEKSIDLTRRAVLAWRKLPLPPKPEWMSDKVLMSEFVKNALRWEGAIDADYSQYLRGSFVSLMDMAFDAGVKAERERSGLAAVLAFEAGQKSNG